MATLNRTFKLTFRHLLPAAVVGLTVGVILAALMIILTKTGHSALPMPLGLAFAKAVFGHKTPLPVGVASHLAYDTIWAVGFLCLFRNRLSLAKGLLFAAGLWILSLVVFAPIVGWGIAGLNRGVIVMVQLAATHFLYGLGLWGGFRIALPELFPVAA